MKIRKSSSFQYTDRSQNHKDLNLSEEKKMYVIAQPFDHETTATERSF